MYYVYILQSVKYKSFYIGYTNDLRKRFEQHNNGLSKATKARRPYDLVYYEAYKAKKDALIREKKLKRFKNSYTHLKNRIIYSTQIIGGKDK